ncbi:Ig domain-containing protein, partial [Candidatus Parcubacteria bacterium]|nr:Ig domain-containing protein [Candidatus Parcubacteria bacterium]
DPINKLGDCGGDRFNPETCWDEENKEFADSDSSDPALNLPAGSNVYVYTSSVGGSGYEICGVMESGLITTLEQGACAGSSVRQIGDISNNPPVITGANLPQGYSGEEYIGYIEARDPDGDQLLWTLDTSATTWPMWSDPVLSIPPTLENTEVINQKSIKSNSAGQVGNYQFSITIYDGRGLSTTETYTINIVDRNPPVIQPINNYTLTIGDNLIFTVLASDIDNQYPLSFTFLGTPSGFAGGLDANLHDWNINGAIIDQTQAYNSTVIAYDLYLGESDPVNFSIIVENQPPNITTTPVLSAIACVDYNYPIIAADPDGHEMTFSAIGLPAGLALNTLTPSTAEITGIPTANPPIGGFDYAIQINVQDQYFAQTILPYTASDTQDYNLTIVDEIFSVNTINNKSIYVYPTEATLPLYFSPTQFNATAGVTTANPIVYSLTNNPPWLIINSTTGTIQGTPTDNITDPGSYNITAIAANYCGAVASTNFLITVSPNEWCGDTIVQTAWGETCEFPGLGTGANDQYDCASDCIWSGGWCGDTIVQTAWGEVCEFPGLGTGANDQYDCASDCIWSGGWCGDTIVQTAWGEVCEAPGSGAGVDDQYECTSDCDWIGGWCGDTIVQTVFGETCEAPGSGTGANDQYNCAPDCIWSGGWCGDGTAQVSFGEECDKTDLNGETCSSLGYGSGTLQCDSGCSFNISQCYCAFDDSNFDNCTIQ